MSWDCPANDGVRRPAVLGVLCVFSLAKNSSPDLGGRIAVAVCAGQTLLTAGRCAQRAVQQRAYYLACMFISVGGLERTGCVRRPGQVLAKLGRAAPLRHHVQPDEITALVLSTFIKQYARSRYP